MGSKREK